MAMALATATAAPAVLTTSPNGPYLVPCPPGLPYEMQQVNLLRVDRDGYVDVPPEEMARLASVLRHALAEGPPPRFPL